MAACWGPQQPSSTAVSAWTYIEQLLLLSESARAVWSPSGTITRTARVSLRSLHANVTWKDSNIGFSGFWVFSSSDKFTCNCCVASIFCAKSNYQTMPQEWLQWWSVFWYYWESSGLCEKLCDGHVASHFTASISKLTVASFHLQNVVWLRTEHSPSQMV